MASRILLRQWRVTEASPSGCHVWFDPARETVELYAVDPREFPGVPAVDEMGAQRDFLADGSKTKGPRSSEGLLPF